MTSRTCTSVQRSCTADVIRAAIRVAEAVDTAIRGTRWRRIDTFAESRVRTVCRMSSGQFQSDMITG